MEAVSRSLRGGAQFIGRADQYWSGVRKSQETSIGAVEQKLLRKLRRLDCGLVHSHAVPAGAGLELRREQRAIQEVFRRVRGRLRPQGHESRGVFPAAVRGGAGLRKELRAD